MSLALLSFLCFDFNVSHSGPRHAVAQLVEALRYKPERPGSIPDGVIEIFH
jgi:hypothetical protein